MLFKDSYDNYKEYENLSDQDLIEKIRNGDDLAEKYFYMKYIFVIKKMVSSFFILGGEIDDLFQEAMIGLIKAVNSFNCEINGNFKYFASLCIRRQIITAIRNSKGYDKNLLNNCISLHEITDYESEMTILDKIAAIDEDPEIVFITKEENKENSYMISSMLSNFERSVLSEYGKGKSYEEISITLNRDVKSIDNALQRIKRKVCKHK
jgi:RNA polymerase sporulation-specific sigma factor